MRRLLLIAVLFIAGCGSSPAPTPTPTGKQVHDDALKKVCTNEPDLAICPR